MRHQLTLGLRALAVDRSPRISILGGGVGGLAVAYYAKKNGLAFCLYEKAGKVGGNCVTIRHRDFFFDSGAHRFHDRNPEVTRELRGLLKSQLKEVDRSSVVYHEGQFIDFPLTPLNLIRTLGLAVILRAGFQMLWSRCTSVGRVVTFEDYLLHKYGRTLAESLLLNYSTKLWGTPCHRLAPEASGERLSGLELKKLLSEVLLGRHKSRRHLDGSFLYPEGGIGVIPERLADSCDRENVRTGCTITKIQHDNTRIRAVELNGNETVDTQEVVSTLPLDTFLAIMEPRPPNEILGASKRIRYRNLLLVAFFLNRESVSEAATIYFPDSGFSFTRAYEPKNRSIAMSPHGKTSLVLEIPCFVDDPIWNANEQELVSRARSQAVACGIISEGEIIDSAVYRMSRAYPVLDLRAVREVQKIMSFLNAFRNLRLSGRSGTFQYAWIHDLINTGREIVQGYSAGKPATGVS